MENFKNLDDFLDENYLGRKEDIINKSALGRAKASAISNILRKELPNDMEEYKQMYISSPDLKKLKGFERVDSYDVNPNKKIHLYIDVLDRFYVMYLNKIPTYSKFQLAKFQNEMIFSTALYYGWKPSNNMPDSVDSLIGIFYLVLITERENGKKGYEFFYTTNRERDLYYVLKDILDELEKYEYGVVDEIDPLNATNGRLDDNSNHFH